jgi:hypothetical protein
VVESSVWSPDSSTLLVTAHDPESECAALSAVDVRTGKATALRRC